MVGIQHNQGLDYVIDAIIAAKKESKTRSGSSKLTPEQIENVAQNAIVEFLSRGELSATRSGSGNLAAQVAQQFESAKSGVLKAKLDDMLNSTRSDMGDDEPEISPELAEQLRILFGLLEHKNPDVIINSITAQEEEVYGLLNEADRAIFYSTSSVLNYSLLYWMLNYNYWEEVLTGDGECAPPEGTGTGIIWYDLSDYGVNLYYPHPTDMSKYYVIQNGQIYARDCHSGLHFSTLRCVCDYPDVVAKEIENNGQKKDDSDWWEVPLDNITDTALADAQGAAAYGLQAAIAGAAVGGLAGGIGAIPGAAAGYVESGLISSTVYATCRVIF